jgi:hypothetical protein
MTLGFDNGGLKLLALLIAVPLLLHLFARSRPPRYDFPSTELLRRAVRATIRVRRPKDWLLLALRTLLCIAVVGLFLRPVLFSGHRPPAAGEGRHVVVVVDATASMACSEGGQTRFGAACAEAVEVLRDLGPRDTANVVWLRARPEAVFPEMAANTGQLRDALRRGSVRPETGSPDAAVALAADLLKEKPGRREICVVSDFQRTMWKDAHPSVPRDMHLAYVQVGSGDAANATIHALVVQPATPLVGEALTVLAEVHNYSAAPANRTVFLVAGESRQSRSILVPPFGSASASFALPGVRAPLAVEASLDEDAFPSDDRRWMVVTPQPHLRVALVGDDPAVAPSWQRAGASLGWARVQPVNWNELGGEAAWDILLVAGWDGAHADLLQAQAAHGCALVIAPAAGVPPAALGTLFGVKGITSAPTRESRAEGFTLMSPHPDDPLLRIFERGARGDPARFRLLNRLRLDASAVASGGEIVLAYSDGIPALVRCQKGRAGAPDPPKVAGAAGGGSGGPALPSGTRWLWNIPLDASSGNYAANSEFVCLFGELLLASRSGAGGRGVETPSGQPIGRPLAAGREGLSLLDDTGRTLPLKVEGDRLVTAAPPPPGLYRWTRGQQAEGCAVVNFPPEESDLRAMRTGEISGADASAAASGRQVRQLRDGIPLWPYLLTIAAAIALVELLAALWAEATKPGKRVSSEQ